MSASAPSLSLALSPQQRAEQRQEQILGQQQLFSLELLAASELSLEQKIREAARTNPAVELQSPDLSLEALQAESRDRRSSGERDDFYREEDYRYLDSPDAGATPLPAFTPNETPSNYAEDPAYSTPDLYDVDARSFEAEIPLPPEPQEDGADPEETPSGAPAEELSGEDIDYLFSDGNSNEYNADAEERHDFAIASIPAAPRGESLSERLFQQLSALPATTRIPASVRKADEAAVDSAEDADAAPLPPFSPLDLEIASRILSGCGENEFGLFPESLGELAQQLLNDFFDPPEASSIAEILSLCSGKIPDAAFLMHRAQRILSYIQEHFEPAGTGAHTIGEWLRLRVRLHPDLEKSEAFGIALKIAEQPELLRNLPELHAEAGSAQQQEETDKIIRKTLGISREQLDAARKTLLQLRPDPAEISLPPAYIYPEFEIRKAGGRWLPFLCESHLPRVSISGEFLALHSDLEKRKEALEKARRETASPKTRILLKNQLSDLRAAQKKYEEYLSRGRMLIEGLRDRRTTLLRMMHLITERQQSFFENGPEAISPLTQDEIAHALSLNASTVSRAINNEYFRFGHRVYPLSALFSSSVKLENGRIVTPVFIQTEMKKRIASEDPENPLSDQKLREALSARGLPIALRTVSKYREDLGILSSLARKEQKNPYRNTIL